MAVAAAPDLDIAAAQVARRLGRLFRIERLGGFERRPVATVRRLIERRGALIDALRRTLGERRSAAMPASSPLVLDLAELAREVGRSRRETAVRLERLEAELRLRRGGSPPSGLRGAAGRGGQLLGRG